ncbi:hypothetical protein KIS1582_4896 [Cytobacillus firmus]|uniref:Uncharacterized protein n=1 Tax=Cytobacillus firmus TaxID=1399 RepID=A0A800MRY8_CYTFI|nr:hypothetical protein KIS1582_4896 [Cytobacillus firmus]
MGNSNQEGSFLTDCSLSCDKGKPFKACLFSFFKEIIKSR